MPFPYIGVFAREHAVFDGLRGGHSLLRRHGQVLANFPLLGLGKVTRFVNDPFHIVILAKHCENQRSDFTGLTQLREASNCAAKIPWTRRVAQREKSA
jgi:hypothetical protein